MTLQFPNNPSNGQSFTASNNLVYVYDGEKWITTGSAQANGDYVLKSGSTMTGDLTVGGDPSAGSNQGSQVRTTGLIVASRTGSNQSLWVGYSTGDTNSTSRITNAGDATFSGNVSAGNVIATGDIQSTSQNGGQLAGFRNQLINSGFLIDQRGLSGVSLAGTKYCLDRWVAASGATVTKLNVTPGGLPNVISYTGGNVSGYMRQAIELDVTGQAAPFNTPDLDWTFSVYSDAVPQFEAFYADDNTALGNQSNWVGLTDMTSTGKTVVSNATGTLTQYSITISNSPARAATNTCLVITFRGGGVYAAPQFEPGPVATPFEHRPIQTELALCQRYFLFLNNSSLRFPVVQNSKTESLIFIVPTPVTMRTTPTVTGTCSKVGVPTGSSFGTSDCTATAGVFEDTGMVRLSGSGFSSTSEPVTGRVNGNLDAEL